MSVKQTTLRSP